VIDLREIDETIDDIKRKGATINDAVTLAMMYIAREHMVREGGERPAQMAQNYARAAEKPTEKEMPARINTRGTSRFLTACDGLPVDKVLSLMDEHLDVIRVLYPKEYDAIIKRLERMRE
jgi:hypothetical protein